MSVLEEYYMNSTTIALLPHFHPVYQTKIINWEGEYLTKDRPFEILARSCLELGADYDGRRRAIVAKTNYKQKTPIHLSESLGLIAVPTRSPESIECAWIMYHHIHTVFPTGVKKCKIRFHNGLQIELNISAASMQQQIQKAAVIYSLFCTDQHLNFSFMLDPRRRKNKR